MVFFIGGKTGHLGCNLGFEWLKFPCQFKHEFFGLLNLFLGREKHRIPGFSGKQHAMEFILRGLEGGTYRKKNNGSGAASGTLKNHHKIVLNLSYNFHHLPPSLNCHWQPLKSSPFYFYDS